MKKLIFIFLMLGFRAFAAANGDVVGAWIDPNGREMFVCIQGLGTGGTYQFGLSTNNQVLATTKLLLTVTRPNYDSSGLAGTTNVIVAATKASRIAGQTNQAPEEYYDSPIFRTRVVLARHIMTGDVVTLNAGGGFYVQGGTNSSAVTGLSVTNNSVMLYPPVVCNWTMPAWQRIQANTMTLSAVGFHWSGQQRRPVKMCRFIVTDEHGASVSSDVTDWSIQRSLAEYIPSGELVATIDTTGFTDHDQLRCDFVMFPWEGDTNAVFDTRNNRWTGLTPQPTSVTNLLDRAGNYAIGIAAVDPTFGSDSNGRVTNLAIASIPTNFYFASIAGAANKMSGWNQTNTGTSPNHADVGGGKIYLSSNVTAYAGGTFSSNNVPKCYLELMPIPGHTVSITTNVGTQHTGARLKVSDVSLDINSLAAQVFGTSIGVAWFQRCTNNSQGTAPIRPVMCWWTDGSCSNVVQGFNGFTGVNTSFMVRNTNLEGLNSALRANLGMGNWHLTTNKPLYIVYDSTTVQANPSDGIIYYNNIFLGDLQAGGGFINIGNGRAITFGEVYAQNVFECATNGAGASYTLGGTDTTAAVAITNLMMINNTFVGQRALVGYNSTSNYVVLRVMWSFIGEEHENDAYKADLFTPVNAARTNNWDVMYALNSRGNMIAQCAGGAVPPVFPPNFSGINSRIPNDYISPDPAATNTWGYLKYIYKATVEQTNTVATGGGNYRHHTGSPSFEIPAAWYLPFDLDGLVRGTTDPAGAFISGSARKGSAF